MSIRPLVSVVDDDESVHESLPDLVRQLGFSAQAFSSGDGFLASGCIAETRCLIIDIVMPGMSGPDLYGILKDRGYEIPVIFITSRQNESIRAHMIELGAVDCLFKPFSDTALLAALNTAFRIG